MEQTSEGYYFYKVSFVYRQKSYNSSFLSTVKLSVNTDPLIAWAIADDAIKERMKTIPDKQKGIYPHSIVISGDFGSLTIKE